ncbi:ABC transporter permease [Rathayibacter festucae]|uniref:ABC transporter permease n=1 Tax=Rathayibacter festucae TaxID=110937 RepID=UPI002A6A1EA7|nr:ABC transporter permease [Rathayibacter festucae]MDY0914978.1 ABC transporter permease [Rathayibacter festucae]
MAPSLPTSGLRAADLLREALAGLVQRPTRTVLTLLGPLLGVGAFVVVLGLTATASGQISEEFSLLEATQVTVTDAGGSDASDTVDGFPPDAESRADRLDGVVASGVSWTLPSGSTPVSARPDGLGSAVPMTVAAATPGWFGAAEVSFRSGRAIQQWEEERGVPVAVVGAGAARQLGLPPVAGEASVFLGGVGYTVVGILGEAGRDPLAASTIYLPAAVARQVYGPPSTSAPAVLLVETEVGAAGVVAQQLPIALRPDAPATMKTSAPPDRFALAESITASLADLFLALAAVILLIGAVGIANTTLVAVLERTPEIGLRRAIGARPRHVFLQILLETGITGTLGGLLGTTAGIAVVVANAALQQWTAILDPLVTASAPLLGTLVGVLAGLSPAIRAARIEPIEALRR